MLVGTCPQRYKPELPPLTFPVALSNFIFAAQTLVDRRFAGSNQTGRLSMAEGPKNVRVILTVNDDSRSVYCFVAKETGDVLQAAGWKAAAKGARSNIYATDAGASGIDGFGAIYKR